MYRDVTQAGIQESSKCNQRELWTLDLPSNKRYPVIP